MEVFSFNSYIFPLDVGMHLHILVCIPCIGLLFGSILLVYKFLISFHLKEDNLSPITKPNITLKLKLQPTLGGWLVWKVLKLLILVSIIKKQIKMSLSFRTSSRIETKICTFEELNLEVDS
jgi:hypothetical protein